MDCVCEHPWDIHPACYGPLGAAPFAYSSGLAANQIRTEIVVSSLPLRGTVAGGGLGHHDLATLMRHWAHDLIRGDELGDVALHDGLTAVRPAASRRTLAEDWADGERHLCQLDPLETVTEVEWAAEPRRPATPITPVTDEEVDATIAPLARRYRPAGATAGGAPAWHRLHAAIRAVASDSPHRLAPLGSLVPLQADSEIGPDSTLGHLRALAHHHDLTDELDRAGSAATDLADEVAWRLWGPDSATWEQERDTRHHGLHVALTAAYGAVALTGHVPRDVHYTAVTTLHGTLVDPPPRPPGPPLGPTLDGIADRVRRATPAALRGVCSQREQLERLNPALRVLQHRLTALRLGVGRLHPPCATRPAVPDDLPPARAAVLSRLLDDVYAALDVRGYLSVYDWQLVLAPLTAQIDLADLVRPPR